MIECIRGIRTPLNTVRMPASARIGEQVEVPAQHGVGPDEQVQTTQDRAGQRRQQRGEESPVRRRKSHLLVAELALQDGHLVTQGKDLGDFVALCRACKGQCICRRSVVRCSPAAGSASSSAAARVFRFGVIVSALASMAGGFVPNGTALLAARVVQGCRAAIAATCALTLPLPSRLGAQDQDAGRLRRHAPPDADQCEFGVSAVVEDTCEQVDDRFLFLRGQGAQ